MVSVLKKKITKKDMKNRVLKKAVDKEPAKEAKNPLLSKRLTKSKKNPAKNPVSIRAIRHMKINPMYLFAAGISGAERRRTPVASIPEKAWMIEIIPHTEPATNPMIGPKTQAITATGIPIKVMVRAGVAMVPIGVNPNMIIIAIIKDMTANK